MATNEKGYLVQLKSPEGENVYPVIPPEAIVKSDGSTYDFDSLFTSVSNGKALVASAITDKGVETAADATYQQMAENVSSIPAGIPRMPVVERVTQSNVKVGDIVRFDPVATTNYNPIALYSTSGGATNQARFAVDSNHYINLNFYTSSRGFGYKAILMSIDDHGTIKNSHELIFADRESKFVGYCWLEDTSQFLAVVTDSTYRNTDVSFYEISNDRLVKTHSVTLTGQSSIEGCACGYGYDSDFIYLVMGSSTTLTEISIDRKTYTKTSFSKTLSIPESPSFPTARCGPGFVHGGGKRYRLCDMTEYSFPIAYPEAAYQVGTGCICGYKYDSTIKRYVVTIERIDGMGRRISTSTEEIPSGFDIKTMCMGGALIHINGARRATDKDIVCSNTTYPAYFYDFDTKTISYLGTFSKFHVHEEAIPMLRTGNHLIVGDETRESNTPNACQICFTYDLYNGVFAIPSNTVSIIDKFNNELEVSSSSTSEPDLKDNVSMYKVLPVIGLVMSPGSVGDVIKVMPIPHIV